MARPRGALLAPLLALLLLLLAACAGGTAAPEAQLRGARLEVLATWSDGEQQQFERVLAEFERRTGVSVRYTSTGHELPELLDRRIAQGRPPDVAFLPQPGLLRSYAEKDRLVPLDGTTRRLVTEHFPSVLTSLASYDGRLYGVWFKVANKSLLWYDVATLERLGAVPPRTLDGLLALADRLARSGVPAFALATADGWTLTDWFENVYLRLAGPQKYDALAQHRIPWTDPSVVRTLQVLARLLAPAHVLPGRVGFEASVAQVFGRPPGHSRAAMLMEGDFVAGAIGSRTKAVLGVDADVAPFPAGPTGAPAVVGGGDVAVQLRPSPAGAALLRFLAGTDAAAIWASRGGFVSPNLDLDLAVYPDAISRSIARQLLEAGDQFRFDLSDLEPPAFGGSDSTGMRAALIRFVRTRDPGPTSVRLERAAAAAFAGAQ